MTLTVSVNPTSLAPGSYSKVILVDSTPTSNNPATITVTLTVKIPAPTLTTTSTSYPSPTQPVLAFNYTTGTFLADGVTPAVAPLSAVVNVASTGDTIPFTVTTTGTGATWVRVTNGNVPGQTASTKTSGIALSGSSVPITVTIDPATLTALNAGSTYTNTVAVAANNAINGSATITVTLTVAAGPPTVSSIFPVQVVASPVVNPTITIYGTNFFPGLGVTLVQPGQMQITLSSTILSQQVVQAVIPAANVGTSAVGVSFTIRVTNPPTSSAPQLYAEYPFKVISATQPAITAVVDSASYLAFARQTGTNPDPVVPVALHGTGVGVSPRELITIFGQNLGPSSPQSTAPVGTPPAYPPVWGTAPNTVTVTFTIPGIANPVPAPLIMVSSSQINAVVPEKVATVIGAAPPGNQVTISVINGTLPAATAVATAVLSDPGVFSFDGMGKGQAAVLNYDATSNSYVINSSSTPAAKNSTILIYATGMGDLVDPTNSIGDGQVASGATPVSAIATTSVTIGGQPAVVTYAGTTPQAVAGLVQINAIIPPNVTSGSAPVPLTVSVGDSTTARTSQAAITISVK